MNQSLTLESIRAALARIAPHIIRTPVLTNAALDAESGAQLFFKCENLQVVGAFKARGGANAVFRLGDLEAERGVATHSSDNHAAALARSLWPVTMTFCPFKSALNLLATKETWRKSTTPNASFSTLQAHGPEIFSWLLVSILRLSFLTI